VRRSRPAPEEVGSTAAAVSLERRQTRTTRRPARRQRAGDLPGLPYRPADSVGEDHRSCRRRQPCVCRALPGTHVRLPQRGALRHPLSAANDLAAILGTPAQIGRACSLARQGSGGAVRLFLDGTARSRFDRKQCGAHPLHRPRLRRQYVLGPLLVDEALVPYPARRLEPRQKAARVHRHHFPDEEQPNTWRWHQKASWVTEIERTNIKNISIPARLWRWAGDYAEKATPSFRIERWAAAEARLPARSEPHLMGLRLAARLFERGRGKEERALFASELAAQPEMTEAWLRTLVLRLRSV
jgi:hypothetical protein